ncbi:MAG: excinuclease ABC subunit UvrB [Endomicrobiales bacterium]|nr:excinuclease ABC subunit UvrB [Endomicrobiales bacterium]
MGNKFKLKSAFKPAGDQPLAIKELYQGIKEDKKSQVLLGVTGSGKTFAIANLIEKAQKPTLVISPNKILAAQLYAEFKSFFPENAVEYFISYYDYYQPEAYIPQSDTYIEKDASINDHIDRLRLKATSSLLERRDVIIVASVSCIYNLGSPEEYKNMCVYIEKERIKSREVMLRELVDIHYERNDIGFVRGKFRVKGDTVEIFPAYLETALRIEYYGDRVERIREFNPLTGKTISEKKCVYIYPARHFVTPRPQLEKALKSIENEMIERVSELKSQNKLLEAQRLEQRTKYDMEMMNETGFCHGVENYSCHLSGRSSKSRPPCLIDYFYAASQDASGDFLTVIDESHIGIPQVRGMYEGDKSRKQTLVDFGFRLPSALGNRPLKFNEFESLVNHIIYVSATPGPYELNKTQGEIAELVIRPTGLIDPEVIIRPIDNQINDLRERIDKCVKKKQRVLVTTLTKRLAEDLSEYLNEKGFQVQYLHSEIDALKRIEILKNLRLGKFDVLVGINLLREGLDLPEVALVAVLDADKEGFLRSETTLIQICGRAARNIEGKVILYADKITGSMRRALDEMNRRREKQAKYNEKNKVTPRSIVKAVHELEEFQYKTKEQGLTNLMEESGADYVNQKNIHQVIRELERQMREAADNLDFELAAVLRDKIKEIKEMNIRKARNEINRNEIKK